MKDPNSGLKIILVMLVIVLIIGIAALVFLVLNYNKGSGRQEPAAAAPIEAAPEDLFPTNGPTKDSTKMIISEIRNAGDGSIASVSLMIPESVIGLNAEVNGVPAVITPIDSSTIQIDIPAGVNTERVEINFKAGPEVRTNCILNKSDIQRTEGNCIW